MKKFFTLSTAVFLSVGSWSAARAETVSLATFFSRKVAAVELELAKAPPPAEESFVLQDINVDISPDVSFGINSIVSLQIAPEVDFVLTPPVK